MNRKDLVSEFRKNRRKYCRVVGVDVNMATSRCKTLNG